MPDFRPQSTDDDLDSPGEIYATKFVSEVAALVLRSPGLRASHFDSARYRGGHRFSGYKHHLTIGSRPISLNISPLVRTTLLIASIVWTGIRMVRTTWRNPNV